MNRINHWTQASTGDFSYSISLDFFTQLEDRMLECGVTRKELSKKLDVSPSAVSQVLNTPPENPHLDTTVQYARSLGLKVALVAYFDGDPGNDKGPIFSGVFAKCWEAMGMPRDLSWFVSSSFPNQISQCREDKAGTNEFTAEKKPPRSEHSGLVSENSNMVGGL